MKTISKYQKRKIWAYINKNKLNNKEKEALIEKFTAGRTHNISQMNYDEALSLIQHVDIQSYKAMKADRMRKKILHYCHLMQWYRQGTTQLDFNRIDEFCIKRGWKHKPLNRYTYEELPMLVTQFEEVYEHFLNKL